MAMDKLAIVAVASITLGVIVVRCSDAHDAETGSTAPAKKQTFHGDQSNLWLWQSRLRGYLKAAEDDSTRSVRNENGMAVYWANCYRVDMINAANAQNEIDKMEGDGVK